MTAQSEQTLENNLRIATNKANELTVKKLTRSNPTIATLFDDLGDK